MSYQCPNSKLCGYIAFVSSSSNSSIVWHNYVYYSNAKDKRGEGICKYPQQLIFHEFTQEMGP
jgi:hypothetical protein